MRSWNHRVIKGQWRRMTRNSFFEFLTPQNYPRAFKNHRNVFYSSHGTRWTLKFCSSSIRSKVIGDHGFSSISALDLTSEVTGWPRTLSLYINLFVSRQATRSFFPRSSSSIRDETARGVVPTPPPPLCRGRMRNGLCRRGLKPHSEGRKWFSRVMSRRRSDFPTEQTFIVKPSWWYLPAT